MRIIYLLYIFCVVIFCIGTKMIEWVDHAGMAPAEVWFWVRATDGISESVPVVCEDEILLSHVEFEAVTFEDDFSDDHSGLGWSIDYDYDSILCTSALRIIAFNGYVQNMNIYTDDTWNFGSTGANTTEFFIPETWVSFLEVSPWDRVYFAVGEDQTLSDQGDSITINSKPGIGVNSCEWEDYTGDLYFGFFVDKDNSSNVFVIYLDYPALYVDPDVS